MALCRSAIGGPAAPVRTKYLCHMPCTGTLLSGLALGTASPRFLSRSLHHLTIYFVTGTRAAAITQTAMTATVRAKANTSSSFSPPSRGIGTARQTLRRVGRGEGTLPELPSVPKKNLSKKHPEMRRTAQDCLRPHGHGSTALAKFQACLPLSG